MAGILALASLAVCTACTKTATPVHAAAPAKVEGMRPESESTTVRLTAQARERLGIEVAPAEVRPAARSRTLGAEVVLPGGRTAKVTATVRSLVLDPATGKLPQAGQHVRKGDTLARLQPQLTPERQVLTPSEELDLTMRRVSAEGDVAAAEIRVKAARVTLSRAERLLGKSAGSARARDDAEADLELAEASLTAAQDSLSRLNSISAPASTVQPTELEVIAPLNGVVWAVHVAPAQLVDAGAPLFEIVDSSTVWIRAPVYAGEVAEVDRTASAGIRELSQGFSSERSAVPASAPPTADPGAATVDLYYSLANEGGRLRPGQRVTATLRLSGEESMLAVPTSAILYDMHGGASVYVETEPRVFVRHRVELLRTEGDLAYLTRGPEAGASVVRTGAAELFGTELGVGK